MYIYTFYIYNLNVVRNKKEDLVCCFLWDLLPHSSKNPFVDQNFGTLKDFQRTNFLFVGQLSVSSPLALVLKERLFTETTETYWGFTWIDFGAVGPQRIEIIELLGIAKIIPLSYPLLLLVGEDIFERGNKSTPPTPSFPWFHLFFGRTSSVLYCHSCHFLPLSLSLAKPRFAVPSNLWQCYQWCCDSAFNSTLNSL